MIMLNTIRSHLSADRKLIIIQLQSLVKKRHFLSSNCLQKNSYSYGYLKIINVRACDI